MRKVGDDRRLLRYRSSFAHFMNVASMNPRLPSGSGRAARAVLSLLVVAIHGAIGWFVLSHMARPAVRRDVPVIEVQWVAPAPAQRAPHEPASRATESHEPSRQALAPTSKAVAATHPVAPVVQSAVTPIVAPPARSSETASTASAAPPAKASTSAGSSDAVASAQPATGVVGPKSIDSSALRYLEPLKPVYPKLSIQLCETGVVILDIQVNERGIPTSVQVEKTSGSERLDQSALSAMRAERFVPYTEGGQARAIHALAPVQFRLDC